MNNSLDEESLNSENDTVTDIIEESETLDLSPIVTNNKEQMTNTSQPSETINNSYVALNTEASVPDVVSPPPANVLESNPSKESVSTPSTSEDTSLNANVILPTTITPTIVNSNSTTVNVSSNQNASLNTNDTSLEEDSLKNNINTQINNLRDMAKPIGDKVKENVKNKVISMKTQIIYAGVGVILIVGVAFGVSFIVNNGPKLVCTRSTGSKLVMKFDESGIKSVTINGKEISDSDIATYQTQFSKDFLEAKRSNENYVEEFKRIVMEYEKSNGSTCE